LDEFNAFYLKAFASYRHGVGRGTALPAGG
jgi:hypothetical protein